LSTGTTEEEKFRTKSYTVSVIKSVQLTRSRAKRLERPVPIFYPPRACARISALRLRLRRQGNIVRNKIPFWLVVMVATLLDDGYMKL